MAGEPTAHNSNPGRRGLVSWGKASFPIFGVPFHLAYLLLTTSPIDYNVLYDALGFQPSYHALLDWEIWPRFSVVSEGSEGPSHGRPSIGLRYRDPQQPLGSAGGQSLQDFTSKVFVRRHRGLIQYYRCRRRCCTRGRSPWIPRRRNSSRRPCSGWMTSSSLREDIARRITSPSRIMPSSQC